MHVLWDRSSLALTIPELSWAFASAFTEAGCSLCIVDSQLDLNILETHLQSAELQINPNLLGQIGLDLAGVCWTMRDLSLQQHRLEHCDEADVGSEGVCGSQQSTPCYGFLGLWKPAGELCACSTCLTLFFPSPGWRRLDADDLGHWVQAHRAGEATACKGVRHQHSRQCEVLPGICFRNNPQSLFRNQKSPRTPTLGSVQGGTVIPIHKWQWVLAGKMFFLTLEEALRASKQSSTSHIDSLGAEWARQLWVSFCASWFHRVFQVKRENGRELMGEKKGKHIHASAQEIQYLSKAPFLLIEYFSLFPLCCWNPGSTFKGSLGMKSYSRRGSVGDERWLINEGWLASLLSVCYNKVLTLPSSHALAYLMTIYFLVQGC